MWHNISWRLLRHELRRGELTIMAAAIVLAVTAVLSLSLFTERLQSGLLARSAEFLAADRVLSSRRVIDDAWLEAAAELLRMDAGLDRRRHHDELNATGLQLVVKI